MKTAQGTGLLPFLYLHEAKQSCPLFGLQLQGLGTGKQENNLIALIHDPFPHFLGSEAQRRMKLYLREQLDKKFFVSDTTAEAIFTFNSRFYVCDFC